MTQTPTTTPTTTAAKSGAAEILETLTGFDEIATFARFGFDVFVIGEERPMMMMRALAFVMRRRADDCPDDATAYAYAMALRVDELSGLLDDDTDDQDDDQEPTTPAGKDEPAPDAAPTISHDSAWPPA